MNNTDIENLYKKIKRDFFSLRNGILADSLKKSYSQDKIIFGLNAPQFMDLAKFYPKNLELAGTLWNDKQCRESRILSLYLMPSEIIDKTAVINMIKDVDSYEEAEIMAFRLLRHLPFAKALYDELSSESLPSPYSVYCMQMFKRNLDQI